MKITNWKRKLAASLVAGGLMSPAALNAAPLDANLVVDPGFEDVGTPGGIGAYLNSWQDGTSTDYAYAVSAGYDNGGPLAGGGLYYFNSNNSAPAGDVLGPGVVSQNVDISTGDSAALIASGEAAFSMSGFFSSYLTNGDFGTMHVEFLDGGGGSLGTSQVSDGDTTTWSQHTGVGPIPVGAATARLSLFGTPLSGGPDGYIDNVDFQVTDAANVLLALDVNTTTGFATLGNVTGDPIDIDYYEILSAHDSLDADRWESFQEQDLPDFPSGNGTGNGWEEAGNVGPGVVSESYLTASSIVADQASIGLGNLFSVGGMEDLVFRYGLESGELVTGFVRYVMGSVNDADFNDDGIVDGDDFLIWQSGFGDPGDQFTGDANGDGFVDGDDFLLWQQDFGGPPSGGASGAVPEPASVLLVGAALVGVTSLRRRREP